MRDFILWTMQGKTCAIFGGVASRFREVKAMAVRALLHYALEIPDLSLGERFYRNFGLTDKSARDEAVHWGPEPPPDFGENKELG
jgi:hypothetical protein